MARVVIDPATVGHGTDQQRTQRRACPDWLPVWLAAGSGAMVMVTVTAIALSRSTSGLLGDVANNAAYSEWLRSLPWWDWRGWSDWFYGGRAVGVHYPPLMHAIGRYTHPVWGQLSMTLLGMFCLLPWAVMRLARAVGLDRRTQLAAMAFMLVVVPASRHLGVVVHGLHLLEYFGLGPSMMAICLGMLAVGHAARCRRPVTAGLLLGLGALFNISSMTGVLIVAIALLSSSGADWKQAFRWLAAAGSVSLTISSWWIVPFVADMQRLESWQPALSDDFSRHYHPVLFWLLTLVLLVVIEGARRGPRGARRLAVAAGVCSVSALVLDLLRFQYADRLLMPAFLAGLVAGAWLLSGLPSSGEDRVSTRLRPATVIIGGAVAVCVLIIVPRLELIPAIVWFLRGAPKTLRALSALISLTFVLYSISVVDVLRHSPDLSLTPQAQAAEAADGSGFLMFDMLSDEGEGRCRPRMPGLLLYWSDGRVKPLTMFGAFDRPTEFIVRGADPRLNALDYRDERSRWAEALRAKGDHQADPARTAELLGARWLAQCDPDVSLVDLPATRVTGERVTLLGSGDAWHQAAVSWWIDATARGAPADVGAVPALGADEVAAAHPAGAAARGVTVEEAQDRLTVTAASPGWAWVRVPWDPWWKSSTGEPVLKGGPGHLVVWARQGATELVWDVPAAVDAAAATATAAAAAAAAALAALNRRRGFRLRADRPTPAADTARAFHDTIDQWASTARTRISTLRRPSYPRGP